MGFGDKLKAGMSNVNSRLNQSVDSAEYDSKISSQKRDKEKAIAEAGQKMFEAYIAGTTELTAEVKELFDKAKACDAEIEKLEKEKQEMKDAAHQEREDRRAEVKAKEEEEKAQKEAEKAQKEAEKKKEE
jgi:uncharacterized protein YbcC (UPF0753/DUF2309 family)